MADNQYSRSSTAPVIDGRYGYHPYHGLRIGSDASFDKKHAREESVDVLETLASYKLPEPVFTKKGVLSQRQPKPDPKLFRPLDYWQAQIEHYGLKAPVGAGIGELKLVVLKAVQARSKKVKYWSLAVPEGMKDVQRRLDDKFNAVHQKEASKFYGELGKKGKMKMVEQRETKGKGKRPREEQAVVDEVAKKKPTKGKGGVDLSVLHRGTYIITCPGVTDGWDFAGDRFTLSLHPSTGKTHMWGKFDFGVFEGVLRSTRKSLPSVKNTSSTFSFTWRGRETGEGEMQFGPEYTGSIVFLGGGKIEGKISWLGEFEFTGSMKQTAIRGGSGKAVDIEAFYRRRVESWKQEYHGINYEMHEYEGASRWGGWHEEPRQRKEQTSDTEDEGGSDEEEDGYAMNSLLAKVAPNSTLSHTFFPPRTAWLPERDMPSLDGKVVLVTGGNSGIGFETCLALLKYGGYVRVYLAARSPEKGKAAIKKLLADVPNADVRFLQLDLADLRSVRRAAEEFLGRESRLDVLFNNGGVMTCPVSVITAQGWDGQFGTNTLGHYFLTKLLIPALTRAAPARVINTASSGHEFAPPGQGFEWDALMDGPARDAAIKKWGAELGSGFSSAPWKFYGMSKLGNIIVSNILAHEHSDVLVSCALHPGGLNTELQRNQPAWQQKLSRCLLHPAYKGAWTQLWAGTSAPLEEINGKYLIPWARVGMLPKQAASVETQEKLKAFLKDAVIGF
ncbi:Short-chain dehydrogenase/reductase family protein [Pseudohyphozyma bogoriensis]|nr:Short-chain dehydrogenase/reductase family protein [Pseudohyphozyma bogoriensis]